MSKIISYDLVYRKDGSRLFNTNSFNSKLKISKENLRTLYRYVLREIIFCYYQEKRSVSQSDMKTQISKLGGILFQKSISFEDFKKGRKNISKIIYYLIIDYFYHNQNQKDAMLSLSFYFYIYDIELNNESIIDPIDFVKQYSEFFNLRFKFPNQKEFSSFLSIFYQEMASKDDYSFIYILTNDILDNLIDKYQIKDESLFNMNDDRKCSYFFIFEKFIIYVNFLFNFGDGQFSLIEDKVRRNLFFEKIFKILFIFSNVNHQIAIMVLTCFNLGY